MFSSLYFFQNILFNLNLQLDKIILLTRYVNYKFLLVIPVIFISWLINTYQTADWHNLTYLYLNILFIYFIFLSRLPKLGKFSLLFSNFVLIVHAFMIFFEASSFRAQGILGANGAFVFLVFSLSQRIEKKHLLFLFLLSSFIAYFQASRSTLVLSLGIITYLSLKTDLPRNIRVVVQYCILLAIGIFIYLIAEYISTSMLRGISLELILEVENLNYEEIIDKFSDTPLISDLDRLLSLKVFLQNFDLTCLFGCYWTHERPLHNTVLELIFFTGMLGMVTVYVLLMQLFNLTKRCIASGLLMCCASLALITGPIQFFPLYYYSLRMLLITLREKTGLI